jgi:putative nucleotidyltransferase with HDIG domain
MKRALQTAQKENACMHPVKSVWSASPSASREQAMERVSEELAVTLARNDPAASRNDTLQVVLDQVRVLFQTEGVALVTINSQNDQQVVSHAYGIWAHMHGMSITDSEKRKLSLPFGRLNTVSISLMIQDQTVGTLYISRARALSPEDQRILTAMGDIAANALQEQQRITQERQNTYDVTLAGWVRALELRDNETEQHTRRVTDMTVELARMMERDEEEVRHIRRGALLHDIGKMAVPDSILLKPGPLTDQEWAVMREHPRYAYDMLAPLSFLQPAMDIPLYHHEKWDGSGYPYGLQGEQIPLAARIFAVIDVWDALSYDRPYRKAWSEERIREHIKSLAGSHFDPKIVSMFLRAVQEKAHIFSREAEKEASGQQGYHNYSEPQQCVLA